MGSAATVSSCSGLTAGARDARATGLHGQRKPGCGGVRDDREAAVTGFLAVGAHTGQRPGYRRDGRAAGTVIALACGFLSPSSSSRRSGEGGGRRTGRPAVPW